MPAHGMKIGTYDPQYSTRVKPSLMKKTIVKTQEVRRKR